MTNDFPTGPNKFFIMRKKQARKRPLLPDPRFSDQLVTRFVNMMMWDGKKSVAFNVFYDAMDIVEEKKTDEEKTSLELWKDALSNIMPHVEVRSRRVGGATFQIPKTMVDPMRIQVGISIETGASVMASAPSGGSLK